MTNYAEYTIKGKTVGIRFGLPAVRRINETGSQYPIADDMGNYNNLGVAHIVYAGYLNACMVKEIVPSLNLEDFYDEIEEGFFTQDQDTRWKDAVSMVKVFSTSFVVRSLLDQQKKTTSQTLTEAMTPPLQTSNLSPDPRLPTTGTE